MPDPFLVMATQNPIETEGTYALPEAQVDRFMLKVLVGYPTPTEEFVIVERMTGFLEAVHKVLTTEQLLELQKKAYQEVYVDPALIEFAIRVVTATRQPQDFGLKELEKYILFGASPRASINLILTGRVLAFVRGRSYVLPQDVVDMALDVLRHRVVPSYEALSDGVSSDDLIKKILERIPVAGSAAARAQQGAPICLTRPSKGAKRLLSSRRRAAPPPALRRSASSSAWTGR